MARKKNDGPLGGFEGRPVLGAGINVKNAGDGLSKSLAIDPVEYHTGDTVFVVLECEVGDLHHKRVKDTDGFRRVHDFITKMATVVDGSLVGEAIDAQRVKIESAQGIDRLPFTADNPEDGWDDQEPEG